MTENNANSGRGANGGPRSLNGSAAYSTAEPATTAAYPSHRGQPRTSSRTDPARNGAMSPPESELNGNENVNTSAACTARTAGQ